jgi:ammonium transporter, Amt family
MKSNISEQRSMSNDLWGMTGLIFILATFVPSLVMAEETAVLNSGDTAWMLTATALVLFMTIPGLSLFYAGMVRSKNVLSVLMQCFAITSLMTILWVLYAYSIAFGGEGPYCGGLDKMFLKGVGVDTLIGSIPETVFMTFQMTFAIITPALIVGAFAERMKFSAMLILLIIVLVHPIFGKNLTLA